MEEACEAESDVLVRCRACVVELQAHGEQKLPACMQLGWKPCCALRQGGCGSQACASWLLVPGLPAHEVTRPCFAVSADIE